MCVLPFTPEFMRPVAGDVHAHRAGRAAARRAGRGGGELHLRPQGGRERRTLAVEGRRFGFAVEGVPLAEDSSDDDAVTISSTYIRACVAAGDMVAAAARAGPAAPRGRRRRPRRPPRPGDGLPDGERGEPAVHRHPGRRGLRRAPGDPRPAQRRQPGTAPGGDLGRAPTPRSRAAGAPWRPSCSTTTATSTASTSGWSSSQRLRGRWRRSPRTSTRWSAATWTRTSADDPRGVLGPPPRPAGAAAGRDGSGRGPGRTPGTP